MAEETRVARAMRADGIRNRARLLTAAAPLVARDGASVSLEEIARSAGVGSATLHRHFPTRWALLQAIFRDRVDSLAALSEQLTARDAAGGLEEWLGAVTDTVADTAGLAAALDVAHEPMSTEESSCHDVVTAAGARLLDRAKASGGIASDVTMEELLAFSTAISAIPHSSSRSRMLRAVFVGLAAPEDSPPAG